MHVLGLPPAFALSQDQTLKLDENFSRLITTFDEVPRLCVREARLASILLARQGVDLKRRPPKSRPTAFSTDKTCLPASPIVMEPTVHRDPAVHVSLSSDSPVKQPGTNPVPLPLAGKPPKPVASDRDRKIGHRISVRSFKDAPPRRGGGEPYRRYIGVATGQSQHLKGIEKTTPSVQGGHSHLCKQYRELRPGIKRPQRRT